MKELFVTGFMKLLDYVKQPSQKGFSAVRGNPDSKVPLFMWEGNPSPCRGNANHPNVTVGHETSLGSGSKPLILCVDLLDVADFSIKAQQAKVNGLIRHIFLFSGGQKLDCPLRVVQILQGFRQVKHRP